MDKNGTKINHCCENRALIINLLTDLFTHVTKPTVLIWLTSILCSGFTSMQCTAGIIIGMPTPDSALNMKQKGNYCNIKLYCCQTEKYLNFGFQFSITKKLNLIVLM